MKQRTTALLVAGLLLVAGVALAQNIQQADRIVRIHGGHHGGHHAGHGPGGHEMLVAHLTKALDLTAEQQASAKEIHDNCHAKAEPLFAELERLHGELEKAFDSNAPAATVGELAIAQHKVHEQMKALHTEAFAALEALLTAEQQETFKKLKEEHPMLGGFHRRVHVMGH
jgi:Spy/CpxP family protein refolding chaperone